VITSEYGSPPVAHYDLDDSNVTDGAWNHCGREDNEPFSWFIVKQPVSHDELLFAWNTLATDATAWALYWSPGGLFTGGTANTRPTATDEVVMPLQKPLTSDGYCSTVNIAASTSSKPTTTIISLKDNYVQHFISLEFIVPTVSLSTGNKCLCVSSYSAGSVYTALSYENKSSTVHTGHTFLSNGVPAAWAAYKTLAGSATRENTASAKANQINGYAYIEPIALVAEDGTHGIFGFLADRWWGADSTQVRQYRNQFNGFSADRGYQGWTQVGDVVFPLYDGAANPNDTFGNSEGTSTAVITYSAFGTVDFPPIGDYALDVTAPTFAGISTATAGRARTGGGDWYDFHNTVTVTWAPGTDDTCEQNELEYIIYFSKTLGSDYHSVSSSASDNAAIIDQLEPNATYYFYVECRDTHGNQSHEVSPVVLSATTAQDPSIDIVAPTFDGITSAVALNENTVHLTWDAGTDAVTLQNQLVYEIHYSTSASATFEVKGESTAGATSYDVTNLQDGTTYYFRVRCRDAAGNRSSS
jgi:hypothetical protein